MAETSEQVQPSSESNILNDLLADDNDGELNEKVTSDLAQNLLSDDAKPEVKKEDKEETNKTDEELEEEDFKLNEATQFSDIPKRKEILKEFPELFKKFPGVESAIYRDRQFTAEFPTPEDAKEAKERVEEFSKFESLLLNGSLEEVLNSVKEASPEALRKIGDNILDTLKKVDNESFYNVTERITKRVLISAFNSGKQSNNEDLQKAAAIIHQYLFNTPQISDVQRREEKPDPRENELNQREQEFNRRQLNDAYQEVAGSAERTIMTALNEKLDPRNTMSDYTKRNAMRDVMIRLDRAMKEDSRYQAIKDKLWTKAMESGFSNSSKADIRNAILSRARTLLPDIVNKVRVEAMKGNVSRAKKEKEDEDDERPLARSSQSKTPSAKKSSEIPKNVSTLEYLMQD